MVDELKGYINYSGGAIGADTYWELQGEKYGAQTIAYSFIGHKTRSKNAVIVPQSTLNDADVLLKDASNILGRNPNLSNKYIANLLRRNSLQVINSDAIFAVSKIIDLLNGVVDGGTGWAVAMGIQMMHKNFVRKRDYNIYVFCQDRSQWFRWTVDAGFVEFEFGVPVLTKNFAGIGSRNLKENGMKAIDEVYIETIKDVTGIKR